MRLSSYIIPTKVDNDKYLLVHGYTGAVDLVDSAVAECLSVYANVDVPEAAFDENIKTTLMSRGYLTEKSIQEEYDYVSRMADLLHRKSMLSFAGFTFVVTYDCNFRCPYCFERESVCSRLGGRSMTREVVDAAYKAIDAVNKSRLRPSRYITLFGGEPLLKENLAIVEYIVGKGVEQGFKFRAITNSYDLNYFAHLLSNDKINSVQTTIDGMAEMHNSKRVHRDGVPTFDRIIENMKIALDKGIEVGVRFNTDKSNFQEMDALKQYLNELGYADTGRLVFDSARLINHEDNKLDESFFTQKEFVKEHAKNKFEYGCKDFGTYSKLYKAISTGKPLPYKASFCGAQHGSLVFDPFYRIYPCWEVIGEKEHETGYYKDGAIVWNEENLSRWNNSFVSNIPECQGCKCALLCGGGCPAHSFNRHHCTCMADLIHAAAQRLYKNEILK